MSGDKNELRGYSDFVHKKSGADATVTHQLMIKRVTQGLSPSECTLDNVLQFRFCFEMPVNGSMEWVCKDPDVLGDLGHAHIEN